GRSATSSRLRHDWGGQIGTSSSIPHANRPHPRAPPDAPDRVGLLRPRGPAEWLREGELREPRRGPSLGSMLRPLTWGLIEDQGWIMGGKPFRASRQWPLRCSLAHFDDSGFGRSALSSWSIGGHSPLLQRSQNFLLLTAAVELVPLASGPPSPPQAASVSAAASSMPAAINLKL